MLAIKRWRRPSAAKTTEDDQRSERAVAGRDEDVRSLVAEAGKMLRSMTSSPAPEASVSEGSEARSGARPARCRE